jgi:hypothetical protein
MSIQKLNENWNKKFAKKDMELESEKDENS